VAYPNVWDFAGGHVEPGESPHGALARELLEELGIELDMHALPAAPALQVVETDLDLSIWVVSEWTGEPTNLAPEEHDRIAWFDKATALGLPLAHPSCRELIEQHLTPAERQPVNDPKEA